MKMKIDVAGKLQECHVHSSRADKDVLIELVGCTSILINNAEISINNVYINITGYRKCTQTEKYELYGVDLYPMSRKTI